MSGIVYTIEEAVEQTGWSKEKIIKNAQQGNFIIEKKTTSRYGNISIHYDHIIQDEFNKLLELAGKPSITQLEATIQAQQEEIERLKADNEALALRVTQLESKQSTDNSEPSPKSKTTINAFFTALNKAYPNLNVAKIIEHSDGNISDKTIYNYLKNGI